MTGSPQQFSITASADEAGQRLDKFLTSHCAGLTRSRIQTLIAEGHAGEAVRSITDASYKVKAGNTYFLTVPPAIPSKVEAREIPLKIIYEDAHLLVIDKPAGMTVHPAPGHSDDTLVNALLAHCGDSLSGIGGVARPGIVHRIDKDTSGLLIVAKHDGAHQKLSAQLADRSLSRTYMAFCWGIPSPAKGTIEGNIGRSPRNRKKMAVLVRGGKEATTHYEVVQRYPDIPASLVECKLETGRTHQIRIHLAHLGHALIGDPLYGKQAGKAHPPELKEFLKTFRRQALHACEIRFIHPESGQPVQYRSELPNDLEDLKKRLQGLK